MITPRPHVIKSILFTALTLGIHTAQAASINATLLDSYETGLFNASASEITAYSPVSHYFFVTSSATNKLDVLQLDSNNQVTKFNDIALLGGGPNSVAVYGNVVAVAVQASVKTDNGTVEFYDATTLAHLNSLTVGALPDMLVFSPDGSRLLVANEGEPNDTYTVDPEGSVSIINMTDGAAALNASDVATVSFASLLPGDLDSSTRVFGYNSPTIAQDFEPEYITVDPDGVKAYVTLQENNALAIVDIASATLVDVVGLGFKDHSLAGNYMDSSDRDPNGAPVANIISRPVFGMYQPDSIASFTVDGQTYLITANEGDARTWGPFNEESRVSSLDLDNTVFPTEAALKNNASLGRLNVTNKLGDTEIDGDFDALYAFGARSFSIWNTSGVQVYDSGDDIEQTVLAQDPTHFNYSHDDNSTLESRSDNKGPEPEAATVAKIGSKTYAFIGLERQSAILVYDVSIPTAPVFEQYLSNRNFAQPAGAGTGGDLGPEGILFVPASKSPNGNHLLVVSNEISGSTTFYNLDVSITGPSSSASPYLVPSQSNVVMESILTVGDSVNNKPDGVTPYRMVGIPDGLGAFDNGNGTFTVLMNHELGNTAGIAREHGAIGSFVSKWIVNKNDFSVVSGEDLIKDVKVWNGSAYVSQALAINRMCSADLPALSAFYDADSSTGYNGRIFMNGEEAGAEGRAFAHLMDGTSYELPHLGKFSYENAVANPATGVKTVVVGTDDSGNGQVYVYVGTKTNAGLPVDQAGLTNGSLYGVKITGLDTESDSTTAGSVGAFTLYSLGDVSGLTGAQLESNSGTNVSKFQRPEDGVWDKNNTNDFYFLTTASFTGNSRLWRLRFTDASNPALGGSAEMLLEGDEGQKMMDNIEINHFGQILIQEDPGNQTHIAKVWRYDIANDTLTEVAQHDPDRFITGAPNDIGTQDEESSGILDVSSILGKGWYLMDVQAHYNIVGELVQGGQLLAMHIDDTDTDSDDVPDSADNCSVASNADQLNTDGDAQGNACDADDDNDGISDIAELAAGTNPLLTDTDGDGADDDVDAFPLDATESLDTDGDNIGDNTDPLPDDAGVLNYFASVMKSDKAGTAVAFAGDVDGDGYGDYVIGMPGYDVPAVAPAKAIKDAGRAVVLSGKNGDVLMAVNGAAAKDAMGSAVAGNGDINDDGFADVVVGALLADGDTKDSGTVTVLFGPDGDATQTLSGTQAKAAFGAALALADVNGDDHADILVGAPKADDLANSLPDAGSVTVISGSDSSTLNTFYGAAAKAYAGTSVAVGDTNDDSYADIAVGATGENLNASVKAAGSVTVYELDGDVLMQKLGAGAKAAFGQSVAVGDIDQDGYDDIIVGASGFAGSVTVFSGNGGAQMLRRYGNGAQAGLGGSVAVGDVDGDGTLDILAGAARTDKPGTTVTKQAGSVTVWSGEDYSVLATEYGDTAQAYFGTAVSAGDINSDGQADVIVGIPGLDLLVPQAVKDVGAVQVLSGTGL